MNRHSPHRFTYIEPGMYPLIERLVANGPTLLDGAWGTQLQAHGLTLGELPDAWNLIFPERVKEVALAYVEAGSQIILTNTFGANRIRLAEYGLADKVAQLNRAGVQISSQAAGSRALVFGSIGPTGKLLMNGDRPAEKFIAEVGLENNDDTQRGAIMGNGSVTFHVLAGGKELFASPILRLKNGPLPLNVALDGAEEFEIRVKDAGDGPLVPNPALLTSWRLPVLADLRGRFTGVETGESSGLASKFAGRLICRSAPTHLDQDIEIVPETLDDLFPFKRRIRESLSNVPFVEEDTPVVCACYPSARRVLLWNLLAEPTRVTVMFRETHRQVQLGPLDSIVLNDF